MVILKYGYLTIFCFMMFYIMGCGFEDPYVPDSAGSSMLTGRIVADPVIDITGAEVLLRDQDSFSTIADSNGKFYFQNIPPGSYSLQVQKAPYLQESFSINIRKATDEDIGDMNVKLKGAIAGTIPSDKIGIIDGDIEIVVYVNGIPCVPQKNNTGDFVIDISSPESKINIHTVTKTTVYIDNVPYRAKVLDGGNFIVEFVPPGIYNDIQVKLSSKEGRLPIILDGTIEVKSGQTRFLPSSP